MAEQLSEYELRQVMRFFQRVCGPREEALDHQGLQEMLDTFHSAEVKLSGQDRKRLASPGGPRNADIGLILHHQSEDDAIDAFWDPRSATINLLKDKGINGLFCFGFDWHWRAQSKFTGKPGCPASTWSDKLRRFHDQFSMDVLESLRLPFLLTASSCTRDCFRKCLEERVRKHNGTSLKSIDIQLSNSIAVLRFDLDFRYGSLHRIILHVHHPVSGFYTSPSNKQGIVIQLDAGLNFFLWLLGRDFEPASFRQEYSRSRYTRSQYAGLSYIADTWRYIRKESENKMPLNLTELCAEFVNWSSRYIYRSLHRSAADILASGQSLPGMIAALIRANMSASHQKRLAAKHPAVSALKEKIKNSTTGPEDAQGAIDYLSLNEMNVPIPFDDLYEDHSKDQRSALVDEQSTTSQLGFQSCQGSLIKVWKNGDCTALSGSPGLVLRFRTTTFTSKKIHKHAQQPRIFIDKNELQICAGTDILYKTPIERLLQLKGSGTDWFIQLVFESQLSQNLPNMEAKATVAAANDAQTILENTSFHVPANTDWEATKLRKRLLQGAYFTISPNNHKVCFRNIQISMSMTADKTVFLQAFLTPVGVDHVHKCVVHGQEKDPACRLAVNIRYIAKGSGEEKNIWWTTKSEYITMQLNSLVDFLDGKEEGWTAQQPRRFLPRGRGRGKHSYTSNPKRNGPKA